MLSIHDISASAATLFYTADQVESFCRVIAKYSDVGNEEWRDTIISCGNLHIKLIKEEWAPGNIAAITILKTFNYMKQKFGSDVRSDHRVDYLLRSKLMVGLVLDPEISEDDERLHIISEIIFEGDGVMFNGQTLIDSNFKGIILR